MFTRHNACCILTEMDYLSFDQPQTRHYEQSNKKSLEIMLIADKMREKYCKVDKAFQSDEIAESLTNIEIITYIMVSDQ